MSYIERPGFRLNYKIEGTGQPTIVIGSHIYYPRTFSQNLRKYLRMIFLDQRAFSKPFIEGPVEEIFSLSSLVDDIEALRQQLGLEKVIILGHSIHAFIALEYAHRYPDAVSHVILIANSPIAGARLYQEADRYFDESVCPDRKNALLKNLSNPDETASDPFISRMIKFGPMIWYDYSYNSKHLWEGVHLHPEGANHVWGKMFEDYKIPSLNIPTFLALGRYDYWNPPHLWDTYRSQFENLKIRIFECSGHTPHMEESKLFDHELLNWLKIKA